VRHAEAVGVGEAQLEVAWAKLRKAGFQRARSEEQRRYIEAIEEVRGLLDPGLLQPVKHDAMLRAVRRAEASALRGGERGGELDGPLPVAVGDVAVGDVAVGDVAASSRSLLQAARAELSKEACERLTKQLHPDWFQPVDPSKLLLAVRHAYTHAEAVGAPADKLQPLLDEARSKLHGGMDP